jgi:cysteine desulfurase
MGRHLVAAIRLRHCDWPTTRGYYMIHVYLDDSATTKVNSSVVDEILPFLTQKYGNPSSQHEFGHIASQALTKAREQVSRFLGCTPWEIVFTSSATESDNMAIKGLVWERLAKGQSPHIIMSAIEHQAVTETCYNLREYFGCSVTRIPVDGYGMVDPDSVRRAIRPETAIISCLYANGEVGTIQPILEIANIAHEYGITFHTDAVQAAPWLVCNLENTGADLLSLSGHKVYGPKGVGVLFIRKGLRIIPLINGGSQEFGLRSGTENVPLIVGLGVATELIQRQRELGLNHVLTLRDKLIKSVLGKIEGVQLTGHPTQRLPNHASFVFENVDAMLLLDELSERGIMASSGAACSSRDIQKSHVLVAMGLPATLIEGSLRLTLGYETTEDEIDYVIELLPEIISDIRRHSPNFN